jgi:hypothetical protein
MVRQALLAHKVQRELRVFRDKRVQLAKEVFRGSLVQLGLLVKPVQPVQQERLVPREQLAPLV